MADLYLALAVLAVLSVTVFLAASRIASRLSVTVNTEAPAFDPDSFFFDQNANAPVPYSGTIEVVFEDFYDPRVDGCVFGPTVRSQDGRIYKVQAVNSDGTLDNLTQQVLDVTCFNQALRGVRRQSRESQLDVSGKV